MSEQASLTGVDTAQAATDRFLFAILPDHATAARAAQMAQALRREHGLHGVPLPREQLHVSLLNLGNYIGVPPQLPEAANWAATRVMQNPFTVQFNRLLSFKSRSRVSDAFPAVLAGDEGLIGLETLRQSLLDSMRALGQPNLPKNFEPHMTLLYDQRMVPERTIEPLTFAVNEFVLLQRHIGQRRPYTILGRWQLRGDGGTVRCIDTRR